MTRISGIRLLHLGVSRKNQTVKSSLALGKGIYSLPDIAFILRLPQPRVRRWMRDFWDNTLADRYSTKYSWGDGKDKTTDFYTLIEFYVFYQLRELNVSPKKILIAHDAIARQLNTPYPFASSKVLTDGRSILYALEDGTTINADNTRQIVLRPIIEAFCKKIEFSNTALAERYYPLGRNKNVIIDPHHQFGQPIIDSTNILAETIYNLHEAGESVNFLSRLYNLSKKDVTDAIEFYNLQAA